MSIAVLIVILILYFSITIQKFKKTSYYKITKNPYFSTILNKGRNGEYLIYKNLRKQEESAKFLFNCYLPKDKDETTEIDVLMIHPTGIYVFESKNYSGWIFGDENSKTWTQTLSQGRGRKSRKEYFYNPVAQNKTHIKWLTNYLNTTNIPVYSIIVFSERCTLKDIEIYSPNTIVIKRDSLAVTIGRTIKLSACCLTKEELNRIYDSLYPLTQLSTAEKQKHIRNIKIFKQ